jgi:poly(beta-D-mannuronate) lyase
VRRDEAIAVFLFLAVLAVGPSAATGTAADPCPEPPTAVTDITAERFYTDPANSIEDPSAEARNKASLRVLDEFISAVVRMSDKAVAGDVASGYCAAAWLDAWAEGDAMLGRMSSMQAEYERKWRTVALGFAYLKVIANASVDDRGRIGAWLDKLAGHSITVFAGTRHSRNNLLYWAGLAAGVTAAATGEEAHWAFAREAYDEAMRAVGPDGTLPLEMARKGKALHYHNFALAALVMLAEVAAHRGENFYDRAGGAIHRLADRVLSGIADPGPFGQLAGVAVEVPKGSMLGWLAFYSRRFPDRIVGRIPAAATYWNAWLGGDMTELAKHWIR